MSNHETDHSGVQCEQQSEESDEHKLLAEFHNTLSDYDLLPLFERQYNAFVRTRQYSMRTNEKLRTRWLNRCRGKSEAGRVISMPIVSDYHFYNCRTILNASLSPGNYPTLRFHLKPGPGVDKFGQCPIPADMMQRKSDHKPKSAAGKTKPKKRTEEASGPHKLGVSV